MRTMDSLFKYQLNYILNVESQLIEGLSIMASSTSDRMLNEVLEVQLEKTKYNKQVLSELVDSYYRSNKGVTCLVIQAYLQEMQQLIKRATEEEVLNVGLMAETQKLIHFKISIYNAATNYANSLNYGESERILNDILEGENQDLLKVLTLEQDWID